MLCQSSNLLIEFTKLIWEPVSVAADGARVPTPLGWRPWNEALAVIDLVADHEIVEAAHAIDAEIWRVHQQVKRGWVPHGEWLAVRDPVEARRQDFVNIARTRLAATGPPLRRLTGRPPSGDPTWKFRRSDFASRDGQETSDVGKSAIGPGEAIPSEPQDEPSGGTDRQQRAVG